MASIQELRESRRWWQKRRSEKRGRVLAVLSTSARDRILEAYHSQQSALIQLTNTVPVPATASTESSAVELAEAKSAAHPLIKTSGRKADKSGPPQSTAGANSGTKMLNMPAVMETSDIEIVDITDEPDPDCVIVEQHLNLQDSPMQTVQQSGTDVTMQLSPPDDAYELELHYVSQNSHTDLVDVANSMFATIKEMQDTLNSAISQLMTP